MNLFFRNPFENHRLFFLKSKSVDPLSRQSAGCLYHNPGNRPRFRRTGIYACLIIILFIFACKSAPVKEINTDINKNNIKIRYVNIGIIFDYMVNSDPDAAELKKHREDIQKSIDDIRKTIDITEEEGKQGLLKDLKEKQGNLVKLKNDEDFYKAGILNEIDSAIESIAKNDDIDFVFNIGEGAVYARKEYDITERVLQEIESRAKRNAPVSR